MQDVKTTLFKLNFIENANIKFNNKFDYSLVEYKNTYTPVTIICPVHGEFQQRPEKHLETKHGCSKCSRLQGVDITNEFIEKAEKKFEKKFDYSLAKYENLESMIVIICPIHGQFEQKAVNHLRSTYGCTQCFQKGTNISQTGFKSNTTEFVNKAINKHGDKFDYSLVDYKNAKQKVKIRCNTCQTIFEQKPNGHLDGKGCLVCSQKKFLNNVSKTNEEFIKQAIRKHRNKYNYAKTNYIGYKDKIIITCKIHGDFEQKPQNHLEGSGCPICGVLYNISELKLLNKIKEVFPNEKINHQIKPDWLKFHAGQQSFDIYLPDYNIAIEYQGAQHFKPVKIFGGSDAFKLNLLRDDRKRKLCLCNSCKLYYFTYDKKDVPKDYPHKVYFNEDDLIEDIKSHIAKTFSIKNL